MSITSRNREQGSSRHWCASVTAISLACLVACHWAYAVEQDRSASISFDEFIDQTTGDEVPKADLLVHGAYRGKHVYKSLPSWIDRLGYYRSFVRQFQQWCSASGGRYVRKQEVAATCLDGASDDRSFGAYEIESVSTTTKKVSIDKENRTFYFFRQQEMEIMRKDQLAREERARDLATQRQIAKANAEVAAHEQALRDLPIVKKTGQKICRTVQGMGQSVVYVINGRQIQPQYLLTAFTENAANDKIQLRIAGVTENSPTGFTNVDRLLLDGNIVLQSNVVIWDDPLLWHPC